MSVEAQRSETAAGPRRRKVGHGQARIMRRRSLDGIEAGGGGTIRRALALAGGLGAGAALLAAGSVAAQEAGARRMQLAQAAPAEGAAAAPAEASATPPRPARAAPLPTPSANTTIKLIELLIQNGLITRDQADSLLRQAQAEAAAAQPARPPRAAPRPAAPEAVAMAPEAAVAPGTVRVPYVPEVVRRQLRDEVTRDVLSQVRPQGPVLAQGAVTPGSAAAAAASSAWAERVRIYGDLRVRFEQISYPGGNAAGFFPNFASINNSSNGFDLAGTANAPFLNVTEDRTRYRLRARIGIEAKLADWVTADFRIATGNDSSPVSANQTFGAVNSATNQFGTFSKYAIWLDRAYMRFTPADWLKFDVGRMPNPFRSTELLYHVDLGFDGVAATARHRFTEGFSGFLTAGAFPYYNTDLNFSTTDVQKFKSRDRTMVGVQGGADWRPAEGWGLNLNLGYYNFLDAEGALSQPCAVPFGADACNTDISRSFFTQNTNTFFPIRNLIPNPQNPGGPQPQFFGLASRFEILDIYARIDYSGFAPYRVTLEGNYLNNLGFSRSRIAGRGLLTDGAPNGLANNIGDGNRFIGGNQGYMIRLTVGHPEVQRLWAWNAFFTYRYLESDAVLDALNDSDFRLGGTNSKGYVLGGTLGIAQNVALRGRWFSGEQVAGPRYAADTFLLDLMGRF